MELNGTWHLVYSTFNMWRGNKISGVTFNYTPTLKNGETVLLDEVRYVKDGEEKVIRGYDQPDMEEAEAYTWHGTGWLKPLSSNWKILWSNDTDDCALIVFDRTLFTAAGADIICRYPNPDQHIIAKALFALAASKFRPLAQQLYQVGSNNNLSSTT